MNDKEGKNMQHKIDLTDVNLSDDKLFAVCMRQPEFCRRVLSIILDLEFVDIQYGKVQETYPNLPGYKSIRLDVFAKSADGTIYNIEMQKVNNDSMPKRARFYQGILDASLLLEGREYRYSHLPNTMIIFITDFDVFGRKRYQYTFTNQCRECTDLELNDGTIKMFLNLRGEIEGGVSASLLHFLSYVSHSKAEVAKRDPKVKELNDMVENLKHSQAVQEDYIRIDWAKEEGREEGREEGEKRFGALTKILLDLNNMEQIKKALEDKEFRDLLYHKYHL